MIEAIVAVYSDWGIGCGGTQPVVVPEDRRHFRDVTDGSAVIVGRKTLADFPGGKPLKSRVNIVLTSHDVEIEGALVVHTVDEAVRKAAEYPRVFVIGGASVYSQLMPHIDRIFVTKIESCPHSDAFFTDLDAAAWRVSDFGEEKECDGLRYRFMTYERI